MEKDNVDLLEQFLADERFQIDYLTEDGTLHFENINDGVVEFTYENTVDGTNPSPTHHFVVWFPSYVSNIARPMGLAMIPAFITRAHSSFHPPTPPSTPSSLNVPTLPPAHSSPMVTPASTTTQQSWSSPMVGRSRRDDTAGVKFFQGTCPVDVSSVSNPLKRHSDVVNESIQKISTSTPPPNPWT